MLPTIIAALSLIGVGLLLYPAVAAYLSQYAQSQRIDDYSAGMRDLGADTLHQALVDAQAYNAALAEGGALIAANERLPLAADPTPSGDYAAQLRGDEEGLMARIRIPSIDLDLPVYHGTGEAVLETGVGHLEGTALPVGGVSTRSVLTAHRGLATSELFTHLDQVTQGDTFTIEVFGEVLVHRVIDTRVVEPTETESLLPVRGDDLVTLVTCTPLGVNSHRILVTGQRLIPTPRAELDAAGDRAGLPGFPWWAVIGGGALLAADTYVWLSGRPPRAARAPGSASAIG